MVQPDEELASVLDLVDGLISGSSDTSAFVGMGSELVGVGDE